MGRDGSCAWRGGGHDAYSWLLRIQYPNWLQFDAKPPQAEAALYADVLGSKPIFYSEAGDDGGFTLGDEITCGVWSIQQQGATHRSNYVPVADVAATAERLQAAGGKVVVPFDRGTSAESASSQTPRASPSA